MNSSELENLKLACQQGDVAAVAKLLHMDGFEDSDILQCDGNGQNALYWACQASSLSVLKMLLDRSGCDVNTPIDSRTNQRMLHVACERGAVDIVQHLLRYETLELYTEDLDGRNALYYACQEWSSEILKLLLEVGDWNVNVRLEDSRRQCYMLPVSEVMLTSCKSC